MSNKQTEAEKVWKEAGENHHLDEITVARVWGRISQRIQSFRRRRKYAGIAAAAALLFGLGFFLRNSFADQFKEQMVFESGEKQLSLNLKDGSTVLLLPHSKLVLHKQFSRKTRAAEFFGSGDFKITEDAAHPFVIAAKGFEVKVLGTQFLLISDGNREEVNLKKGLVEILSKNKTWKLQPKEIWERTNGEVKQFFSKDYEVSFDYEDETFGKVIADLERIYGMKINYPKNLKNQMVSGKIAGNLEEILEVISYPYNLQVRLNEKNRTIEMK